MSKNGSTGDMERIQRGLEEFLQREMQGMQQSREPQLYDLQAEDWDKKVSRKIEIQEDEYDEEFEEELEEYQEDWDSREHIARTKMRRKQQKKEARQQARETKRNTKRNTKQDDKAQALKKRKKKKSGFRKFLIIVVFLLALAAGGAYYAVGKVYSRLEYEEITNLTEEPVQEEGVVNILLIGNDSRTNGEDGRSDAMILLSVSSKTKRIYMTSLLRDMYVEIPGHKGNRLNAAYSYGGAELLMETIEQNFDITVNRYVLVNFEAFANLVDAVGGIELELTKEEVEYVNAYLWEYNILTERPEGTDYMDTTVSGMVHLNGAQALSYTRNRYLGTDFARTERQRKVLEAIIHKLPEAMVSNPGEMINGLVTNLKTNLTKQECFQLFLRAASALNYELEQNSIPLEGTYKNTSIRGMSVLEVDFEANKEYIQKNIYGKE